jgi:hypothetical protein
MPRSIAGIAVVFYNYRRTFSLMSLNRTEQLIFDYVNGRSEERHYWKSKVQKIAAASPGAAEASLRVDSDLWRYFLERSEIAQEFKAAAKLYGTKRTSLRNLAEYLIRLWTEPRPKPPKQPFEPERP